MSSQSGVPSRPAAGDEFEFELDTESAWRNFFQSLVRVKPALFGAIFLVSLTFTALVAPILAPSDPTKVDVRLRLRPPFWMEGGEVCLGPPPIGRKL